MIVKIYPTFCRSKVVISVIEKIELKILSQTSAASLLGISTRQVRNLQEAYRHYGAAGLVSKRRGKPSNNRISEHTKGELADIIRTHYSDFKPTLAHEKLCFHHGCSYSRESIRRIMIEHGLWCSRSRKQQSTQQLRERRPCVGELVQIDGSPHDWFEGRSPECCLIVFVDDASSSLLALWFVDEECTQGYFDAMRYHLEKHGRPVAYYHDKHSIFRVNIREAKTGNGLTQFGRACQELGIESIAADTPQAKGRVERLNKTLQDRLVKEMRLAGINDKESANAWLPNFIEQYNTRFEVAPKSKVNAHREDVPNLDLILVQKHQRKLSKQLELSYNNTIYQIQTRSPFYAMRHATVVVCDKQGEITILYKGKPLDYKTFNKNNAPGKIISAKAINRTVDRIAYRNKPKKDHPWNKGFKVAY